jgi:hypothetical protein
VRVDHPDMARPDPVPTRVREFMASFAPHPALAWALEQYRRFRAH